MTSCKERRDGHMVMPLLNGWNDDCQSDHKEAWTTIGPVEAVRPKAFDVPFSSVLADARQLSLFIDMDNEVLGGTPRVGGTRIPVYRILNAIDEYGSIDGVRVAYRSLTTEQVRDAIQFAARVLEFPVEHETETAD